MIFLADGIAGNKLFPASDQRLLRRRHVAHALQLQVLVIGQLQRGQRRVENVGGDAASAAAAASCRSMPRRMAAAASCRSMPRRMAVRHVVKQQMKIHVL